MHFKLVNTVRLGTVTTKQLSNSYPLQNPLRHSTNHTVIIIVVNPTLIAYTYTTYSVIEKPTSANVDNKKRDTTPPPHTHHTHTHTPHTQIPYTHTHTHTH